MSDEGGFRYSTVRCLTATPLDVVSVLSCAPLQVIVAVEPGWTSACPVRLTRNGIQAAQRQAEWVQALQNKDPIKTSGLSSNAHTMRRASNVVQVADLRRHPAHEKVSFPSLEDQANKSCRVGTDGSKCHNRRWGLSSRSLSTPWLSQPSTVSMTRHDAHIQGINITALTGQHGMENHGTSHNTRHERSLLKADAIRPYFLRIRRSQQRCSIEARATRGYFRNDSMPACPLLLRLLSSAVLCCAVQCSASPLLARSPASKQASQSQSQSQSCSSCACHAGEDGCASQVTERLVHLWCRLSTGEGGWRKAEGSWSSIHW